MYHYFGNLDLDRSYHTTICDTNLHESDMFEEAIMFENKAILIVTLTIAIGKPQVFGRW
jgi:hypothetical protein